MKLLNKAFLQRFITGLILTVGFLVLLFFGSPIIFVSVFSVGMLIALYEIRLISKAKYPISTIAIIFLALVLLLFGWQLYLNFDAAVIIILCLFLYMILVLIFDSKMTVSTMTYFFTMTMYLGIAFYALVYVYLQSPLFILFIAAIAFGSDVGGYLVGSLFGKHKLAPTISPKKSWEGSIGGILFAFISVFLIVPIPYQIVFNQSFVYPFNGNIVALIIVIILLTIISQLGDLFTSVIKRYFGVKDFGTIFPGHGGILDRFDSFLAVTIFMALFMIIATQFGSL